MPGESCRRLRLPSRRGVLLIIGEYHLLNTYGNRELSADVAGRHDEVVLQLGVSAERLLLAVGERVHAVVIVADDILLRLAGYEEVFGEGHVVVGEPQVAVSLLSQQKSYLLQLKGKQFL